MLDSTKDKLKGKAHQVAGGVKEKVGELTKNPKLQDEGTTEKFQGKVQKKIAKVERALGL